MAKVIDIMNPQVNLVIDEDNGKLKQAFLDVSGENECVSTKKDPPYRLGFSPSAKLTCSGKPMKWGKLQDKITQYNKQRYNNQRTSEDNWCTFVKGYRNKNAKVEIKFYDETEPVIIEDDDILGLPKC